MKKKLYKAKKNWVIGLIAGTMLILGGTTIASADSNASSVNSNLASQSQVSTYPSFKSLVVTSTQDSPTVGMSSQIASNPVGDYNKDNVGYINPNQERNVYNDQVENDSYKIDDPGSLKYREKLLNGFAKGNDQINNYKTPSVYEYMGDANNPYKYVDPQPITSINKSDTPTYHFLNNGISNAIHYENTNGDPNYEAINHLSQALSYADYQHLTDLYSHTHQDKNFGVFYDGDKAIIAPNSGLTTQDLDALYWAAYKNRPIVTFDDTVHGHHITSFLQSSIQAFDDGWKLSFDAGWRGYTFMDGEQIRFTDIIRSDSKQFSWKNVILRYFAQSLAYKSNEGSQRTPYMLTRSNYLPATDIPDNGGPLENPLNPSITEFVFAKNGVYAIINGAMGGYNPILVHVPMAFLKSDFQYSYATRENPKPVNTEPAKSNSSTAQDNTKKQDNVFDQMQEDENTLKKTIEKSVFENGADLGLSAAEQSSLISAISKDVLKYLTHTGSDAWFNAGDIYSFVSSEMKDFTNAISDFSYDTNMINKAAVSILKGATSSLVGAATITKDDFLNNPLEITLAKNKSPKVRYGIYKARRKRYIEAFKAKKDVIGGLVKGTKAAAGEAAGTVSKKALFKTAAIGIVSTILVTLMAISYYNKLYAVDEANKLGVKLTDRWFKHKK